MSMSNTLWSTRTTENHDFAGWMQPTTALRRTLFRTEKIFSLCWEISSCIRTICKNLTFQNRTHYLFDKALLRKPNIKRCLRLTTCKYDDCQARARNEPIDLNSNGTFIALTKGHSIKAQLRKTNGMAQWNKQCYSILPFSNEVNIMF